MGILGIAFRYANEPEVTGKTGEEANQATFEEGYCAVQQVGAMLAGNDIPATVVCNVSTYSWFWVLRFAGETE